MYNSYANADDVRTAWVQSNIPSGSQYDLILNTLASVASRELDRYLNTEDGFWNVSASGYRYYNGNNSNKLYTDPFTSLVSVQYSDSGIVDNVSGTGGSYNTLADTDYFTFPYNRPDGLKYGVELDVLNGNYAGFYNYPRCVKVGAYFGYITTPTEIKQATAVQAVRWYKRGEQSFQDAGAIKDLGQIRYLKGLDPEVSILVQHMKWVNI